MTNIDKIICGDCVEIMRDMEPESIGLILTSPPYNVGLKYDGFDDNIPEAEFRAFQTKWLEQAYRVAMDTSRMYVLVSDVMLWWFRERAENAGWSFVQKLTWCKPNMVGRNKNMSFDWSMQTEDILMFRKGKRVPMINSMDLELGARTFNWFVETVPQSNFKEGRHHPAQMPIKLCKKIISRTPGAPVLDPFAGSGQVLRAAKALGRPFIGIELVSEVAERARHFVGITEIQGSRANVPLFT